MWVQIPPKACTFVCCDCCVLSGRGLCDELITRPEESYRLWCVVVCDLETSWMRRPWPTRGLSRQKHKQNEIKSKTASAYLAFIDWPWTWRQYSPPKHFKIFPSRRYVKSFIFSRLILSILWLCPTLRRKWNPLSLERTLSMEWNVKVYRVLWFGHQFKLSAISIMNISLPNRKINNDRALLSVISIQIVIVNSALVLLMPVSLLVYTVHAQYFRWNVYRSDSCCFKALHLVASKILTLQNKLNRAEKFCNRFSVGGIVYWQIRRRDFCRINSALYVQWRKLKLSSN